MIEKLEIQEIEQPTGSEYTIIERVPATSEQMHDKINQLVDAVNELQTKVNKMAQNLNFAQPEVKENVLTKSLRMDKEFAEDECVRLQKELERTRKALDVAVDALKRLEKELYFNNAKQTGHIADSVMSIPSIALEQITALEQKE
jgi:HAMP domain-containing protein